jgi:hypothetical protein
VIRVSGCGREQQVDEQADRTGDHDEPDMIMIDRVRRQQATSQFDDRQQRRQTRDGAGHLQDDNGGEAPSVEAQQPCHGLSRRVIGVR